MPERFITSDQAAEVLGISPRRVYAMMASGEIASWCVNPTAQRKRYMTTMDALGRWQAATMMPAGKRVSDWHIPRK